MSQGLLQWGPMCISCNISCFQNVCSQTLFPIFVEQMPNIPVLHILFMWIHMFCLLSRDFNEFDTSRTGSELVRVITWKTHDFTVNTYRHTKFVHRIQWINVWKHVNWASWTCEFTYRTCEITKIDTKYSSASTSVQLFTSINCLCAGFRWIDLFCLRLVEGDAEMQCSNLFIMYKLDMRSTPSCPGIK